MSIHTPIERGELGRVLAARHFPILPNQDFTDIPDDIDFDCSPTDFDLRRMSELFGRDELYCEVVVRVMFALAFRGGWAAIRWKGLEKALRVELDAVRRELDGCFVPGSWLEKNPGQCIMHIRQGMISLVHTGRMGYRQNGNEELFWPTLKFLELIDGYYSPTRPAASSA